MEERKRGREGGREGKVWQQEWGRKSWQKKIRFEFVSVSIWSPKWTAVNERMIKYSQAICQFLHGKYKGEKKNYKKNEQKNTTCEDERERSAKEV